MALKLTIRTLAKEFYYRTLAGRSGLDSDGSTAIIAAFHSISDPVSSRHLLASGTCTSPGEFRAIVAMLRERFDVVPLDELAESLRDPGNGKPGRMRLSVTLDDGYRDNYCQAFPILREAGLPATIFLTTDCVDGRRLFWVARVRHAVHTTTESELVWRPDVDPENIGAVELRLGSASNRRRAIATIIDRLLHRSADEREIEIDRLERDLGVRSGGRIAELMLTWDQVREMARAGIRFGSHTASHINTTLASDRELTRELSASRTRIAAEIGTEPATFCYPNTGGRLPHNDARARAAVAATGYTVAVTSDHGPARRDHDPLRLPRISSSRTSSRPATLYVKVVRALANRSGDPQ